MCRLDSSLRLSSFGRRFLALKWRRLILVTVFTGLEVLPGAGSGVKLGTVGLRG